MTLQDRSDIVLAFTRVLYVNGQSTDDTLAAADRLGNSLGVRITVIPRWGELQLKATDATAQLLSVATANPSGVDMERVAAATRAIEEIGAGQLAPSAALETTAAIARTPPDPGCPFSLESSISRQSYSSLLARPSGRLFAGFWRDTVLTPSYSPSAPL